MTDDELREIVANLALSQAKTDDKQNKLAEAQQKIDAKLRKQVDLYSEINANQLKG
jgi:hypothetical protein